MIGGSGGWASALREELDLADLGDWERYRARFPEGTSLYVPFDTHWNELGHELFGHALAESLVESGLLDP
jgi:hypothetical protein